MEIIFVLIFVLAKRIELIRVVKSGRRSTEYRKDMRDYKEAQNCKWKPGGK